MVTERDERCGGAIEIDVRKKEKRGKEKESLREAMRKMGINKKFI